MDAERKKQEDRKIIPHFWNLHEDPALTAMIIHFAKEGWCELPVNMIYLCERIHGNQMQEKELRCQNCLISTLWDPKCCVNHTHTFIFYNKGFKYSRSVLQILFNPKTISCTISMLR